MTDEILSLQDKMKCLEKENQYLKSLLDQAGISYYASDESYPERSIITRNVTIFGKQAVQE